MAANKYFHFTLGPVQGFVAQARRTRDFWAGSFLLSWLAGVAMAEVRRQQGEIDFPVPPGNYLDWIVTGNGQGKGPRQGAIPNRFKAIVPMDFNAGLVAASVHEAWWSLAEHVWQQDKLEDVLNPGTREIWKRQHSSFWDISWALTDEENASSLIDQRKNWRSHFASLPEPGVKCMVMDGWQEMSASERPGREANTFWQKLRAGKLTDFAENEELCALAYVKRRFVRHFASFKASLASGLRLSGWKLDIGMPSVSYMAAVHWLEALLKSASADEVWALLECARAVNATCDEWDTRISCLQQAAGRWHGDNDKRMLLSLDGNLFFDHVHDNAKAYGYDVEKVNTLKIALRDFKKNHLEFSAPLSPFYAVLMMDGDSLGAHMAVKSNQTLIAQALDKFTGAAAAMVEQHNGYLIYAGGDDVLALLPLEDAMTCAVALRTLYLTCFEGSKIPTTISAAIEYAHVKMPLGKVLSDAHELLDNIAKDGAGRDALAVRVWKPGGMALQWAQPWEIALQNGKLQIEQMVQQFGGEFADPSCGGSQFSNKFFFKIRERFDLLNPANDEAVAVLDDDEACDLLAVDFLNSADNRDKITLEQGHTVIAPLLRQCRAVMRDQSEKDPDKWKTSKLLKPDAALLIRFLVNKGIER